MITKGLVWAAPIVFVLAFFAGYVDDSPLPGLGKATLCALACVGAGGAGWMSGQRIWALINLAGAAICGWAMIDNVQHHSSYSGFGAILMIPVAGITAISMLALAIRASARG